MIGKTISHYRILEKLGEGGMGVVYKAQDTKLDKIVALKFLPKHLLCDSEARTRFEHEAKAAAALDHPNITTIYEIDEAEGECFIAMEYIEGKSLKKILNEKSLPLKETLEIGIQIAGGLNAAHKKGVVHRDIKSDNIMLTHEGLVKITDFGLAKLKGASKITKTGSTLGTTQYLSPEQAEGIETDQRSDLFSFGVVLYEMIAGQLPFKGEHEAAIIYSILNETPEPLARYKANVPGGLQRIIDKALAKDKEERYQHVDDLLADLKREKKNLEYVKIGLVPSEVAVPKPKRRVLPFIVPASIVFVLVLLFLVLKPFKFEIGSKKVAVAKENSLAIMYFENMVDPEDTERIAQMITALLITDLSESPQYMQVVSRQRLYDILKLLDKENLKVIDKTVASEVARRAEVRWVVTGAILQTKPNMVLTSDISDAATGKILSTQRVRGETGEDLFSVVDKLSAQIKKGLSLPAQAKKEPGKPVADVTTHSQEAYLYYLEGVDYSYKFYFTEAERSFEKALGFDSTFAMAYFRLAWLKWWQGGWPERDLLDKAVKYSDKASQKERLYIKILQALIESDYTQAVNELEKIVERYSEEKEAFFLLGYIYSNYLRQYEQAVLNLSKAIEIDSLYKDPYNLLAYTYNEIGDLEKSIWAINKYIFLAPDEANPYDARAGLYAVSGKIDQAIESYKKALKIKPDFYWSLSKLGHMYLFKREYVKAESCYKELCSRGDKDARSEGRTYLSYILLSEGKLEQALEVLDNGIAADRMEGAERESATKYTLKVFIYEEKKNLKMALKEFEKSMEMYHRTYPDDKLYGRDYYAQLLAENNEIAKAEEATRALRQDIEEKDKSQMYLYWLAAGSLQLAKGDFETSIINFEKLAKDYPYFWTSFVLARVYLESGRLGEAVAEFEKALSKYDNTRAFYATWAVKAHYLLGLAFEKSGSIKKAMEQYQEFLDIWKNGDPTIPEIADAKERLKKLGTKKIDRA